MIRAMSRRDRLLSLLLVGGSCVVAVTCGPPKNYTPVDQVPKIKSLEEVMDVQATTADPQFVKVKRDAFTDAEFASFAETARTIDATSRHIKDFSKGPGFDELADRLNATAQSLGKAAEAKNAQGVREALGAMKATCKECHSKYR
jgi:cytochrome c556